MKVTFIQTGGTIDKDYPKTILGYGFEITEPAVKRIMENVNPSFKFEIISIFKKDSTEITEEDRKKLLKICASDKNDKIIIMRLFISPERSSALKILLNSDTNSKDYK